MPKPFVIAAMFALAVSPCAPCAAQPFGPAVPRPLLMEGTLVRVTPKSGTVQIVGAFAGMRGDTVLIRAKQDGAQARPRELRVGEIGRFEYQDGTTNAALAGGVLGGVVGLVAGVVIAQSVQSTETDCTHKSPGQCLTEGIGDGISNSIGTIGAGLAGLVVGAIVGKELGSTVQNPVWRRIDPQRFTPRLSMRMPTTHSLRLNVSVAF